MKVVTRRIPIASRKEYIKLSFIGDVHIGHWEYDDKLFRKSIEKIKEDGPNHYIIGMGDYAEYIAHSDKRFDARDIVDKNSMATLFKRQAEKAASYFEPVSQQILGLIRGNHEDKVVTRYHYDPHEDFCLAVSKVPDIDLSYSAFLKLRFDRAGRSDNPINLYLHHGWGGGGLTGTQVNKVKALAASYTADIYAAGHSHDNFVTFGINHYPAPMNDDLLESHRCFLMSRTFKRTIIKDVGGWAEQTGKKPTSVGCITLLVEPCGHGGIVIRDLSGSDGLPG